MLSAACDVKTSRSQPAVPLRREIEPSSTPHPAGPRVSQRELGCFQKPRVKKLVSISKDSERFAETDAHVRQPAGANNRCLCWRREHRAGNGIQALPKSQAMSGSSQQTDRWPGTETRVGRSSGVSVTKVTACQHSPTAPLKEEEEEEEEGEEGSTEPNASPALMADFSRRFPSREIVILLYDAYPPHRLMSGVPGQMYYSKSAQSHSLVRDKPSVWRSVADINPAISRSLQSLPSFVSWCLNSGFKPHTEMVSNWIFTDPFQSERLGHSERISKCLLQQQRRLQSNQRERERENIKITDKAVGSSVLLNCLDSKLSTRSRLAFKKFTQIRKSPSAANQTAVSGQQRTSEDVLHFKRPVKEGAGLEKKKLVLCAVCGNPFTLPPEAQVRRSPVEPL
ncbi:hypothetical protein JOB18_024525 [Solea senegalensis]|uniref:Uncharacterized protein n=1 Tax=Solea senegalensis TaxID=28829 RepID=A0AAV6RD89_SOLSE|nr:hypothetical protein JOB18_024525 [Solea senegalensis]